MASTSSFEEYTINGVKVKFPYKPYPSQLTMMDKIIKCIERRQNSLLESPTGSGKSLALLCSSIAWLMGEKERILKNEMDRELARSIMEQSTDNDEKPNCSEDNMACVKTEFDIKEEKFDVSTANIKIKTEPVDEKPCIKSETCEMNIKVEKTDDEKPIKMETNDSSEAKVKIEPKDEPIDEKPNLKTEPNCGTVFKDNQTTAHQTVSTTSSICMNDNDDDADFQAPKKRFRTSTGQFGATAKKHRQSGEALSNMQDEIGMENPEWAMKVNQPDEETLQNNLDRNHDDVNPKRDVKNEDEIEQAPKIWFGTRTHKQISQIVRELNKTQYNRTRMCILASREFTCIHPQVSQCKNKTEECRKSVENREGKSCSYYARARHVKCQEDLEDYGITKAWVIEELVEVGKKIEGCPYYMSREILEDADIVFCPYNYLIDPVIRHQMDIILTDQIVIVDEAHNIEDSSRAAASWFVTTHMLDEAIMDLDHLVSTVNYGRKHNEVLHAVAGQLSRWIHQNSRNLIDSMARSKIWQNDELRQMLDELNFNPATLRTLLHHFNKAMKPPDNPNVRQMERTNMHAATGSLFERLFMVLKFLMQDDYRFLCDYRIAITKEFALVPKILPGGFRRKGEFEQKLIHTLNFWCQSPAVAFHDIAAKSRSVVLTSGTLSPLSTFSSELGCEFPIRLEANHVIGNSQVWVSSLSVGPTGSTLNATYRFAETFDFQDEVGEAIHKVCEVVPHGVLCFLPSYSMQDKLINRWKRTGLWRRLCRLKNTFSEPRGGDKSDFTALMSDFYDSIKLSEDSDGSYGSSGALFFAVCRGKVSEGLDFADNNARAVITVGIPFPNVKDTQVELKRKYNNQYCSQRGLLNGNEWYEIQAYRALNQALGRCIRHRNDWGAILLIDERFGKSPKYRNGLSKWLRGKVVHHNNFQNVLSSLKKFAKARQDNPCPNTTMVQTPSGTPKRSSNDLKCSQESLPLLDSSSQSSQENKMDISGNSEESGASPSNSQISPQAIPASWRNVARLRNFRYTPEKPTDKNSAQLFDTNSVLISSNQIAEENPRTVIPTNQVSSSTPIVGRNLAPRMLYITPHNRPQLAATVGSPQEMNIPQYPSPVGLNTPVTLQLLAQNGQPVRHELVTGQRVQLVTQQGILGSNMNNRVMLKIANGQHSTSVQGIRMNTTAQQATTRSAAGGIPSELKGLLSTPGLVRVKVEGQSEIMRLLTSAGVHQGTPGVNQGTLGVHQSTPSVKQSAQVIQGDWNINRKNIQKRPLFTSQVLKPGEDKLGNHGMVADNQESLLNVQDFASKQSALCECTLNNPQNSLLSRSESPVSPLLFVTPPTSFENSADELRDKQGELGVVKVKEEPLDTPVEKKCGDQSVGITNDNIENVGVVRIKEEPMDTSYDTTNENDGSKRMGGQDILDMLDGSLKKRTSNNVKTWNVRCKVCNSNVCTAENSDIENHGEPCVDDISCDSNLGILLSSLFSLKKTRNKKLGSLPTFRLSISEKLQGCCAAFGHREGKAKKQDMKLNCIFCEEESQCYIPLACRHCKESRSTRARLNVIAVRAAPCETGNNNSKSIVWFHRDKVEFIS